jgi:hypothetical protein
MPTLTVSASDRGRTLANNGTVTAVRFMTPPTGYGGMFQLVDRYLPEAMPGWAVEQPGAVHRADFGADTERCAVRN